MNILYMIRNTNKGTELERMTSSLTSFDVPLRNSYKGRRWGRDSLQGFSDSILFPPIGAFFVIGLAWVWLSGA